MSEKIAVRIQQLLTEAGYLAIIGFQEFSHSKFNITYYKRNEPDKDGTLITGSTLLKDLPI